MITFPDPLRVADATFLVRPLLEVPGAETAVHLSSLVILGTEPVLVDTGPALARAEWCEQVFALVEPGDVRWVFLTHDDLDHAGNLPAVLEACPNATLVTSWFCDRRTSGRIVVPPHRQRWVNDGETFDAGGRRLVAIRPPVFDAPTTRGLYDPQTGVYWSADAFGTSVAGVVDHIDELPQEAWCASSRRFAMMLSPWLHVADPARFGRWVDRIARLRPTALVGAHGPILTGCSIDTALDQLRRLPGTAEPELPGQDLLDEIVALLAPA